MGFIKSILTCLGVVLISIAHDRNHFAAADCMFEGHTNVPQIIQLGTIAEDQHEAGDLLVRLTATEDTTLQSVAASNSPYFQFTFVDEKTLDVHLGEEKSLQDYLLEECATETGPQCQVAQPMSVECVGDGPVLFNIFFRIDDVNNQPPVFQDPPLTSEIRLPWPATIPLNNKPIIVTDADFNQEFATLSIEVVNNDKIRVESVPQPNRPWTYMVYLFLKDENEQLTAAENAIQIHATDDELDADEILNLDIKLFNTRPPEFSSAFYTYNIDSPMEIGDELENIKGSNGEDGISATDTEDPDGQILYTFGENSAGQDLVRIDENTGQMYFEAEPNSQYFADKSNRIVVIEIVATEPDGSKIPSRSVVILYFQFDDPTTTIAPETTTSCEPCQTTELPRTTESCPEPTPCPEVTTMPPVPCTTVEPPECTCPPLQTTSEPCSTIPDPQECTCSPTPEPGECPTTVPDTTSSACPDCICSTGSTPASETPTTPVPCPTCPPSEPCPSTDTPATTLTSECPPIGECPVTEPPVECSSTCAPCPVTEPPDNDSSTCAPCPVTESPVECSSTCAPCPVTEPPGDDSSTCAPCPVTEPPVECSSTCAPCPVTEPPWECSSTCAPCETCPATEPPSDSSSTCAPCPVTEPPGECPSTCAPCDTSPVTGPSDDCPTTCVPCETCDTCPVTEPPVECSSTCAPCPVTDPPVECSSTCAPCPVTDPPAECSSTCAPCPATGPPGECPATEPPVECPVTRPCPDPGECPECPDCPPEDECPVVTCPTRAPSDECPETTDSPDECSGTGGLIAGIVVTSILFVASAGAAAFLLLKLRRAPPSPFKNWQPDSADQLGGDSNKRFSLAPTNPNESQLQQPRFSTVSDVPTTSNQYENAGGDLPDASVYGGFEPSAAPAAMAEAPVANIPRPDYALVGFKDTVEIINADELAYDDDMNERL